MILGDMLLPFFGQLNFTPQVRARECCHQGMTSVGRFSSQPKRREGSLSSLADVAWQKWRLARGIACT
jgi:hypothetical protein